MLKLLKMLITLGCLGIFAWFGATVPLGEHTLFGHIAAIGQSKESQELVRGTKEKVEDLRKRIGTGDVATKSEAAGKTDGEAAGKTGKVAGKTDGKVAGKTDGKVAGKTDGKGAGKTAGEETAAGRNAHAPAGPPQDRLTKVDRKEIGHLIETARAKAPKGNTELR